MKLLALLLFILTAAAFAEAQIVASFDAPDTNISGLAYTGDRLYVLASGSRTVYRVNPSTGVTETSWTVAPTGPNGLGYAGNLLYVTNGSATVYKYTTAGVAQGTAYLTCTG